MKRDPGKMRNFADDPRFKDVLVEYRRLLADWVRLFDDKDGLKFLKNE